MSLVRVVLVDVTEDVRPEVSIRDIRAGIAVIGGINPGSGGNLGTALPSCGRSSLGTGLDSWP